MIDELVVVRRIGGFEIRGELGRLKGANGTVAAHFTSIEVIRR